MSKPQRPHLILITTDQQRGDCLGINGNRVVETPNLDHLASRGVNFTRGYSTCPVCIPARRTLLSGQSADSHGLRHYEDGLDYDPPATLPGCLSAVGYQTQLIGKLHLHPQGKRFGFDNLILSEYSNWRPRSATQKRNDYVDWLRQHGMNRVPHEHGIDGNGRLVSPWGYEDYLHHNSWLAEEAGRFLTEKRDPSCPFFLHLSFFYPHPPFVPLNHYLQRYLAKDIPPPILGDWCAQGAPGVTAPTSPTGPFDPEIMRRATAGYYALVNHIDDCIAHVLEQWLGYGTPDHNAPYYLMFSSDHGEMMGDHQLFRKSLGYEASARVPFFITGAHVPIKPDTLDQLVCWEDVAPTLLDLAGVKIPESMDGVSLAPLLRGEPLAEKRDHLFGQCNGAHHNLWIVTARWKYLWFPTTNEEQLFDLKADPNECHDLSGESPALAEMRDLLASHVKNRADLSYDPAQLKPCANRPPKVFWP